LLIKGTISDGDRLQECCRAAAGGAGPPVASGKRRAAKLSGWGAAELPIGESCQSDVGDQLSAELALSLSFALLCSALVHQCVQPPVSPPRHVGAVWLASRVVLAHQSGAYKLAWQPARRRDSLGAAGLRARGQTGAEAQRGEQCKSSAKAVQAARAVRARAKCRVRAGI